MQVATPYLHTVPGRIRIKIPAIKQSAARAAAIERQLRDHAGIDDVMANPTTGNVLICYDSVLCSQRDVLCLLTRLGWAREGVHREPRKIGERVAVAFVETALQGLAAALLI